METNMYLSLSILAFNTVIVRQTTDIDTGVVTNSTLSDIFPDATKYPTSNRVLVGIEFEGEEVPQLITLSEALGFSVAWGIDTIADINIIGRSVAKLVKDELLEVEAAEAIRLQESQAV